MFNDDQKDHIRYLSENPDRACGCGWYTKDECISFCPNTVSRRVEENRISKLILKEREQCARIVEDYCREFWDLKDPQANQRNRAARFHLNMAAHKIRRTPYDSTIDFYKIPEHK